MAVHASAAVRAVVSLLDLLDTQNTRFSAQISVSVAQTAVHFSRYRILASTGLLLKTIGVKPAKGSRAYAREDAAVPLTPDAETMSRHAPSRPPETAANPSGKPAKSRRLPGVY